MTTEFPPKVWGGIGRILPTLLRRMVWHYDQITILVHDYLGDTTVISCESWNGCEVVWSPTIEFAPLSQFIDFDAVDLVNAQIFFFEPLVRQLSSIPCVYTIWSVEQVDIESRRIEKTPEHLKNIEQQKSLAKIADKLITCSHSEADYVAEYLEVDSEKIHVVPCGLDPDNNALHMSEKKVGFVRTLLYVGRITERKGLDLLVAGFDKLRVVYPDIALCIVGGHSGEDDAYMISRMIAELAPQSRTSIEYLGWINDPEKLHRIYDNAYMLVVPSRYEPFGNVVLEAFAHEVPVVAARVGGMKDTIIHEEAGLLFKPESVEDLVSQCSKLLTDLELRSHIIETAYRRLIREYSTDLFAQRTVEVFSKVPRLLGGGPSQINK